MTADTATDTGEEEPSPAVGLTPDSAGKRAKRSKPLGPLTYLATIEADLGALRGARGGLSADSIAEFPLLCEILGGGSPERAHTNLECFFQPHPTDESMKALAFSYGILSNEMGHCARMTDYGERFGCDARTAWRHSSRGVQLVMKRITRQLQSAPNSPFRAESAPADRSGPDVGRTHSGLPLVVAETVTGVHTHTVTTESIKLSVSRAPTGGISLTVHVAEEWLKNQPASQADAS